LLGIIKFNQFVIISLKLYTYNSLFRVPTIFRNACFPGDFSMWIKSNRCNSMQIFIHCKTTLHVSGVTAPIIGSIKNCTCSLRYRSYYLYRYSAVQIRPRWRGVAAPVLWPVPEAAGIVFSTPDDGWCDTRNM